MMRYTAQFWNINRGEERERLAERWQSGLTPPSASAPVWHPKRNWLFSLCCFSFWSSPLFPCWSPLVPIPTPISSYPVAAWDYPLYAVWVWERWSLTSEWIQRENNNHQSSSDAVRHRATVSLLMRVFLTMDKLLIVLKVLKFSIN